MEIALLNLSQGFCQRLVACGRLVGANDEVSTWIAQQRILVTEYFVGGTRHFARLMTGGRKPGHFHLECATEAWFGSALPENTNSLTDFAEITEHVVGQKLDLTLAAEFVTDFEKLPEGGPIRVLSAETQAAGTSIRLTSGVLTVSGSAIREIAWQRLESGRVSLVLESEAVETVAPDYLSKCYVLLERYFDVLVLQKVTAPNA